MTSCSKEEKVFFLKSRLRVEIVIELNKETTFEADGNRIEETLEPDGKRIEETLEPEPLTVFGTTFVPRALAEPSVIS